MDECTALCEGKIRRAAREAGHEPYGRVDLSWHDYDPDSPEAAAVHLGVDPPPPVDPEKVWADVRVQVRPNALRGDTP
jgi:hypothetical protein